ncbi:MULTISPECIES: tetratricopeptide repeat protein [unclassified Variovorax]|jgi:tetratricopeptide (TPR) repeat protein|uniref:tetratricopeptide repeat protein n=1 Tax=unclassified Variovorax TaxID=663243 RepID=UPI000F7E2C45|nr:MULTISPECIES: tetratricopeptide repeat protein [unclassified Variovorax]RSZ47381.1 tetratricopeptide repeat protein [Variovorax sp. 553]RSZ48495.1 tetratricopeptide repeat protein [Variovorax sp. 679]
MRRTASATAWVAGAALALAAFAAHAVPRVPTSDDEVVETLPVVAGWSGEQRRLRRELAQRPDDEATAIAAASTYLELAREQGDARYAGYAMGALQAWEAAPLAQTPPAVLVMRATVSQFLHDFDGAEAALRAALARRPDDAQAWITLATILRVRGRYSESDAACRSLGRAGPSFYAVACLAENAGLRGNHTDARQSLQALLADPALRDAAKAGTRQWLLTSVAEIEELAGRQAEADAAYRKAVAAQRSGYLLLAYSDYLQRVGRHAEIPKLLAGEARSDAVLLRLAIAGVAARDRSARAEADELRRRFEAAALRPGTTALHAREEAMFALDVQNDPKRALELARLNVRLQREPVDLLVFARAASAANDAAARGEVKALMQQIGLKDARVDAMP